VAELRSDLPVGWSTVVLRDVADVVYGRGAPGTPGDIPLIGSGGVYGSSAIALAGEPTIVIGRKGSAGSLYLTAGPSYPSDTTFYLKWKGEHDPEFVYYAMTTNRLSGEHAKTTLPTIQRHDLESLQLPWPPPQEQRAIVDILGAVRDAKAATEGVIAATREFKHSLMRHLFTYGPVPIFETGRVPVKETEFGSVPEAWNVVALRDAVAEIDYGFSAPIPKSPQKNGVKIVSTADITENGDLIYSKIRTIEAPPKTVRRLTLDGGDLLFNWRNSPELIGKTAIFETQQEPHIFASFILRIRTDEQRTHNVFLKHLLNYLRKEGVFRVLARRAVNQANYNRNEISALDISLPPCNEQRLMASILTMVDRKIEAERSRQAGMDALFRSLLSDLMTGLRRVPIEEIS
jgi:type I restriction enzyme S subunit